MAGLMAIKKGEAHVAGTHLLDPETNTYNIPYIKRFLAGEEVVLYPFLKRKQGWFVPKGNPLQIRNGKRYCRKRGSFCEPAKRGRNENPIRFAVKRRGCLSEDIPLVTDGKCSPT